MTFDHLDRSTNKSFAYYSATNINRTQITEYPEGIEKKGLYPWSRRSLQTYISSLWFTTETVLISFEEIRNFPLQFSKN